MHFLIYIRIIYIQIQLDLTLHIYASLHKKMNFSCRLSVFVMCHKQVSKNLTTDITVSPIILIKNLIKDIVVLCLTSLKIQKSGEYYSSFDYNPALFVPKILTVQLSLEGLRQHQLWIA